MGTGSTRWSIIRGAAEGNASDRDEFARLYAPVVRAYLAARWRSSPLRKDADDAGQEVFLACLRDGGALARAEPGRPGGFRAFLYGVVRNVARRFEERLGRERGTNGLDLDAFASEEEPLSRVFDRAWAISLLAQATDLQAERARETGAGAPERVELLRLRFYEGLPIREIALLWDEDAARLHEEYRKARREFQAALAEVVKAHQGGTDREVRDACVALFEAFH